MPSRRSVLAGLTGLAVGCWRPRDPRTVAQIVPVTPTKDGAGVRLRRAIGSNALSMLDPFLLLDEFRSDDPDDYLAGFPDHPHRGFETVTVMLKGAMEHRDSVGNRGQLGPGSVQWMTAGRGIVHSEMPKQRDGVMWGFQLWVNLPARLKMTAPRYQDIGEVGETAIADARVRVLAGRVGGVAGPVDGVVVEPVLLDVTTGRFYTEDVPAGHAAFLYVAEGEAVVGEARVAAGNVAVLGPGRSIDVGGDARFLLAAAAPIGEPVARRGPFVMNTDAEIRQAYADYRSGRLVGG
ncbi:MAG: pirin family protein [Myxococcota bacterium]